MIIIAFFFTFSHQQLMKNVFLLYSFHAFLTTAVCSIVCKVPFETRALGQLSHFIVCNSVHMKLEGTGEGVL